jgi:hypothetical protein
MFDKGKVLVTETLPNAFMCNTVLFIGGGGGEPGKHFMPMRKWFHV